VTSLFAALSRGDVRQMRRQTQGSITVPVTRGLPVAPATSSPAAGQLPALTTHLDPANIRANLPRSGPVAGQTLSHYRVLRNLGGGTPDACKSCIARSPPVLVLKIPTTACIDSPLLLHSKSEGRTLHAPNGQAAAGCL
jgi:hypothetical protein